MWSVSFAIVRELEFCDASSLPAQTLGSTQVPVAMEEAWSQLLTSASQTSEL